MTEPIDVDALERRMESLFNSQHLAGPEFRVARYRSLCTDLLTALRQQQALHKREQETTTVMINGLTKEITRLRAAIEEALRKSDAPVYPSTRVQFQHVCAHLRKALENE